MLRLNERAYGINMISKNITQAQFEKTSNS